MSLEPKYDNQVFFIVLPTRKCVKKGA